MIKGALCHEFKVDVPADELWRIYGSIKLAEVVMKLIPHVIAKVEVEVGDGGVGTIIRTTYPQDKSGPKYSKQNFLKVDNENRVKEIEVIEGGLLELGFTSYLIHFEIVDINGSSAIIKSGILFELDDDHLESASLASIVPSVHVARTVISYLKST
ncbi:S-norcoclaurine synthase [Apostasia shenzhenica]|uniref:S-norcoclaurine synthase n=1 Tax=Apostasia shenzhenica TaxID=1088818 RepID=A0A2I0ATL3_9ASPA|nr:S-norcoclaurine synthase [Apostasia shenzhenica]